MTNIDEFSNTVKSLFPALDLTHLKYGNSINNEVNWCHYHFNIPPSNSNLVNSQYYFKKKSFVHFTSFQALSIILKEMSVRLYNLHKLNDPREFTFASRLFQLNQDFIDDAKDNLFIMSFCDLEILNPRRATDEFNMWRLYGNQGKGVSIVFSLKNEPKEWLDFHLSKVHYGSEKRDNFRKLLNVLSSLNNSSPTIDTDFGKLYAFHKSKLFSPESEVRLLFDRRKKRVGMGGKTVTNNEKQIFPIIKDDLLKLIESNDKIKYLQIPIYSPKVSQWDKEVPLIKIDKILIGYNFEAEADKIIRNIESLCMETLGYKPIVKQSRLRRYYLDTTKTNKSPAAKISS